MINNPIGNEIKEKQFCIGLPTHPAKKSSSTYTESFHETLSHVKSSPNIRCTRSCETSLLSKPPSL